MFRKIIEKFLELTQNAPSRNIVLLGSGFDTNAFRYSGRDVCFFEVDFPEIVESKSKIIVEEENLFRRVHNDISEKIERCSYGYRFDNLRLVSADLRNSTDVLTNLQTAGLVSTDPTLVITECVLVCK